MSRTGAASAYVPLFPFLTITAYTQMDRDLTSWTVSVCVQTWEEVMQDEAKVTAMNMLTLRHDPYMFHQVPPHPSLLLRERRSKILILLWWNTMHIGEYAHVGLCGSAGRCDQEILAAVAVVALRDREDHGM